MIQDLKAKLKELTMDSMKFKLENKNLYEANSELKLENKKMAKDVQFLRQKLRGMETERSELISSQMKERDEFVPGASVDNTLIKYEDVNEREYQET